MLADLFSGRVDLVPDATGRYLWAHFDCDIVSLFYIDARLEFNELRESAKMVAGA